LESKELAYGDFAAFYDQLMHDAPYDHWMTFFEQALARYRAVPRHIADIGCGTGTLSLRLFEQGYKVTGIDLSEEMLIEAQNKAAHPSPRLRFLCQDMRELRLPEPCDVAVSFCDSLNYLLDAADVQQTFTQVRKALRPGGLFLFDMHSVHKLREKLGQNIFYEITDEVSYLWQSSFEAKTNTVEYDITFFALEDPQEELYRRFREVHKQRAYEIGDVRAMLAAAGFSTVEVYADFCWDVPHETSERLFFVAF